MRVLHINNDGSGFADYIEVPDGITVEQLFARQVAGARPEDYLTWDSSGAGNSR